MKKLIWPGSITGRSCGIHYPSCFCSQNVMEAHCCLLQWSLTYSSQKGNSNDWLRTCLHTLWYAAIFPTAGEGSSNQLQNHFMSRKKLWLVNSVRSTINVLNTETDHHQCYTFALLQVRMNDQVIFESVGESSKGQFLHCSTYLLERTGQHLHSK